MSRLNLAQCNVRQTHKSHSRGGGFRGDLCSSLASQLSDAAPLSTAPSCRSSRLAYPFLRAALWRVLVPGARCPTACLTSAAQTSLAPITKQSACRLKYALSSVIYGHLIAAGFSNLETQNNKYSEKHRSSDGGYFVNPPLFALVSAPQPSGAASRLKS
jgi:hypothetical protein